MRIFHSCSDNLNDSSYRDICRKLNKHMKCFMDNKVRRLSSASNISNVALIYEKHHYEPVIFYEEGNKSPDSATKAEAFASYFSSVFKSKRAPPLFNSLDSTPLVFGIVTQFLYAISLTLPCCSVSPFGLKMAFVNAPLLRLKMPKRSTDFCQQAFSPLLVRFSKSLLKEHLLSWLLTKNISHLSSTALYLVPPLVHNIGIRGSILEWFKSYSNERKAVVRVSVQYEAGSAYTVTNLLKVRRN
ncbi:hypothetical protein COOONC_09607 [Cooperia oncophora]